MSSDVRTDFEVPPKVGFHPRQQSDDEDGRQDCNGRDLINGGRESKDASMRVRDGTLRVSIGRQG
jgi:hypothetical protein